MSSPKRFVHDSLRDPAVRDLAWVIGSLVYWMNLASMRTRGGRYLVSHAIKTCAQWLATLDIEPRSLHDFIASVQLVAWQYFESLIAFLLAHIPDTQIIATNCRFKMRTHLG